MITEEDKIEIIKDLRVARLLWFAIGFFLATLIMYFVSF